MRGGFPTPISVRGYIGDEALLIARVVARRLQVADGVREYRQHQLLQSR